ncbi:MAG: glycosyltransferase family A protein [Polyangiaceae bacterium]
MKAIEARARRLGRSLRHFRRDPRLPRLQGSPSPLARAASRASARLFGHPDVHPFLLDPLAALRDADLPLLTPAVDAWEAAQRRRRQALLARRGHPTVSVIMAAYDAEATLEAAARSVLDQTYPPLELLVIDDRSHDRTRAVAEGLGDPRVTVIQSPGPRGAARARNHGLRVARGDVVTFQDADDVSDPERFERQLSALLAHEGAVVSTCNARRMDASGATVTINGRRVTYGVITMMFHRARVLDTIGYFRTELPISEDSEYLERMKAAFGEGASVDVFKTLYHQRFSQGSLLFSDGEVREGEAGVEHRRSPEAEAAMRRFRADLRRIERGELSPFVPF